MVAEMLRLRSRSVRKKMRVCSRMMPEASDMEASENTKPMIGQCSLPCVMVDKMSTPELQSFIPRMLECVGKAKTPSWEKASRPEWWPRELPFSNVSDCIRQMPRKENNINEVLRNIVRSCYYHYGQGELLSSSKPMKCVTNVDGSVSLIGGNTMLTLSSTNQLQDNANIRSRGHTQTLKEPDKSVVQLFVCFFCERSFDNKEVLQAHQKVCSQRPAHLQDICTPNKQKMYRPRVNITNPRQNMYVTALGLLPAEKAKHMELAHRLRRDSQIDCDLIEVDKAPPLAPRTPTTPRTPKSLISFNTPSSNKHHEVYTVSSDDESDSGASDISDTLTGTGSYIRNAPLMTIDFSSPLGQRIKGHINKVSRPNFAEYEKFCRTPVKNRFKERLRERDSFALVTYKQKRHARKYCHTYRFTKAARKDFVAAMETGLNGKSRRLLRSMKPCRVHLRRLSKDTLDVYKRSRVAVVGIQQLTPEQIAKWTGRSSPEPCVPCSFPSTPVVKCYDLKSLLGATPSRLAVLDKNCVEIDEHTKNRVLVYKAILNEAFQESELKTGLPDRSEPGKFYVMKSLLTSNPNPLPLKASTSLKPASSSGERDVVFSRMPGTVKPQSKPKPVAAAKPVSVPKISNVCSLNSSSLKPQQSVQNRRVPQNHVNPNIRNAGTFNGQSQPPRRSGRTRIIEDKIDDEISILVPVTSEGELSPNSSLTTSIATRGKRARADVLDVMGNAPKVPRLQNMSSVSAIQQSQRQFVKRQLAFDMSKNQSKPLASVLPTRSVQNSRSTLNPSINLGTRQSHVITGKLANPGHSPVRHSTRPSTSGLRRSSYDEYGIDTGTLPRLGSHDNNVKEGDKNFLFKCHFCGLEEQYSADATSRIYSHLHTAHKGEVIHIVDYNTQGEVHLVEAMGQPPTMVQTSSFTESTHSINTRGQSTPNPPAYFGISTEPEVGQIPPKVDRHSSVSSVESAGIRNKSYQTLRNTLSATRAKSAQYSLRAKSPPKPFSSVGQPTPPATPQTTVYGVQRRTSNRIGLAASKMNNARPVVVVDDDVVCLDDDVICMT